MIHQNQNIYLLNIITSDIEIEGKSEKEVLEMLNSLQVDQSKITALNCDDIYKQIYNIDISKIKNLKF